MSGGAAPFYRIHYSALVRATLETLGERAKELAAGAEFVAALHGIDGRLRADPSAVGEPFRFLPNLGLHVRIVGAPFFYLRFAVDEGRQLVYVVDAVGSARLD